METIKKAIQNIFTSFHKEDCVCDNCSYYGDSFVDDDSAFVTQEKGNKGWIAKYAAERFGK